MKKLILSLVLFALSTAIPVYAIVVDPAKDGNTIKGHIIEKNTEEDSRIRLSRALRVSRIHLRRAVRARMGDPQPL